MSKKAATKTGQRQVTPADKALGIRIRQARNLVGMSQEELGNSLGVSFQQIQKYEKGVNRVGSTRLVALAKAVSKPVSYFLEEASYKPGSKGERIAQFVASREGTQLCELLVDMHPAVRTELLSVCRAVTKVTHAMEAA